MPELWNRSHVLTCLYHQHCRHLREDSTVSLLYGLMADVQPAAQTCPIRTCTLKLWAGPLFATACRGEVDTLTPQGTPSYYSMTWGASAQWGGLCVGCCVGPISRVGIQVDNQDVACTSAVQQGARAQESGVSGASPGLVVEVEVTQDAGAVLPCHPCHAATVCDATGPASGCCNM